MSRNAFICSQMTHFQEKKASYKRKAYLEFKLKKGTEHTHTHTPDTSSSCALSVNTGLSERASRQ